MAQETARHGRDLVQTYPTRTMLAFTRRTRRTLNMGATRLNPAPGRPGSTVAKDALQGDRA
jgi:hypothetical protein